MEKATRKKVTQLLERLNGDYRQADKLLTESAARLTAEEKERLGKATDRLSEAISELHTLLGQ